MKAGGSGEIFFAGCVCSGSQDGTGGVKVMANRSQMTRQNLEACAVGAKMVT